MVCGAAGVSISMLVLAWAGPLGHWTAFLFSHRSDSQAVRPFVNVFAILGVCALSASVQPLQCALRAIVLDLCPPRQQVQAQSWVARVSGLGQILGCVAGIVYVPQADLLGAITTFRLLSIATLFAVNVCVTVTCFGIEGEPGHNSVRKLDVAASASSVMTDLFRSSNAAEKLTRRVFLIQCFSWMGWFSFLFYNTRYVGYVLGHFGATGLY